MSEIQLVHFSFGGDSLERSRFYEVALREARVATDAHASESVRKAQAPAGRRSLAARLGLRARLRGLAFTGGGSTAVDSCACGA